MWGTARLGFSSFEQVDVEKGFFTQQLFHNPYSGQIFYVAICLEQGVADRQMHVYEWLQQ